MGLYSVLDSADIQRQFFAALEAGQETIWSLPLAYLNTGSNRATEEYNWLGQVPVLSEWIAGRREEFFNKFSLTIANKTYEATVPIDKNDLMRDKTGNIARRVSELAARTNTHWNSLAATFISNGTGGTSGLAYDGQYFFDTDHAESGSSQTNDLTTTEIPSSNVSTTSAPTATEAANILVEAVSHFQALTDDKGEPTNVDVQNITVVCPKATIAAGFKIAAAAAITNLASGASNPRLGLTQNISVVYSPRLTAADAVFVFCTDGAVYKPLIFQQEGGVELQEQTAGSSEEFANDRFLYGVRVNRGIGYGAWQKALYIPLT